MTCSRRHDEETVKPGTFRMNTRFALGLSVMLLPAASAWVAAGNRHAVAEDEPGDNLAQYYGFTRLELYKLQQRSQNMLAADLNNDGKTDLVLIDNSNSRLDLLQQRARGE